MMHTNTLMDSSETSIYTKQDWLVRGTLKGERFGTTDLLSEVLCVHQGTLAPGQVCLTNAQS
jgi:hypothetical protein